MMNATLCGKPNAGNPRRAPVLRKITKLALVAVAVPLLAVGEPVKTAQSGDLAADSTWVGGKTPGTTDGIVPDQAKGVYTLTKDMTFGNLTLNRNHTTFDFTDGNHTLALTTPMSVYGVSTLSQYPGNGSSPMSLTMKGGVWDCAPVTSNRFDFVTLGFKAGSGYDQPYYVVLTNSCTVKGFNGSYLFRRINHSRITVTDGSILSGESADFGDGVLGTNNVIEINGGSKMFVRSFLRGGSAVNRAGGGNFLVVKGEGSSFETGGEGWLYLGHGNGGWGGFGVKVLDKAKCSAQYPTFAANTVGCSIEVRDGASFTAGCFDWWGSECWTLVSNASLTVKWQRFSLGSKGGHHNRMTLTGADTKFSNGNWNADILGSTSHDNVFSIENGASVRYAASLNFGQSTNGTFRVTGNGAKFDMLRSTSGVNAYLCTFGATDNTKTGTSVSNRLEILDGGVFQANSLWVQGVGNEVVVSNGTLAVGGRDDSSGTYGYTLWLGRGTGSDGNRLVMQGDSPRLFDPMSDTATVRRSLIMQGNSVIRFEIPAGGWKAGNVGIRVGYIYPADSAGSKLEIECAEWAVNAEAMNRELVLARFDTDVANYTAFTNWFNKLQLALPDGVTCLVRGTDVILRKRLRQGLAITIR